MLRALRAMINTRCLQNAIAHIIEEVLLIVRLGASVRNCRVVTAPRGADDERRRAWELQHLKFGHLEQEQMGEGDSRAIATTQHHRRDGLNMLTKAWTKRWANNAERPVRSHGGWMFALAKEEYGRLPYRVDTRRR